MALDVPERRWTMDPIQLLKKQHREVEALFKKIEKTRSAEQRRALMAELVSNLKLHMTIEEEIFYPAVQQLPAKKAEDMALEAYEEHAVVKLVLAELPSVDPEDERFDAKMTVLSELIEHHVDEEEGEMFKTAKKLGTAELNALGDRMAAAVETVKGPAATRRGRAA
jgi:hemerythrin-like domain-containing protein